MEGITEWLPISSTGHMILLDEFVQLDVSESFYSLFQVVIQLGAILAVVLLFWNDFFRLERKAIRNRWEVMGLRHGSRRINWTCGERSWLHVCRRQ